MRFTDNVAQPTLKPIGIPTARNKRKIANIIEVIKPSRPFSL